MSLAILDQLRRVRCHVASLPMDRTVIYDNKSWVWFPSQPYYSSFFLLCYIYIPRRANIVQNSNDYMHRVPTQAKRGKVALNRRLVTLRIGNYALDDQGWYPIEME